MHHTEDKLVVIPSEVYCQIVEDVNSLPHNDNMLSIILSCMCNTMKRFMLGIFRPGKIIIIIRLILDLHAHVLCMYQALWVAYNGSMLVILK